MKYHPCPEKPNTITGNVTCDTYGYCPYGEICNVKIEEVKK